MSAYGITAAYTRAVLDGQRSDQPARLQPYYRSLNRWRKQPERMVYRYWYRRAQNCFGRGDPRHRVERVA